MPQAQHLVHDQPRVHPLAIKHEHPGATGNDYRFFTKVGIQIDYRQELATHVGNTAHPGTGVRDARQCGVNQRLDDLAEAGKQAVLADAKGDPGPLVFPLGLVGQAGGRSGAPFLQ